MAFGDYANSGSTYTSNTVPGWLNGINDSSIYDNDKNAKFAIGSCFKRSDGSIFRYVNSITGVAPHKLVSHNGTLVDNAYATSLVTLGTASTQQSNEPTGTYPSLIGSRYVLIVKASTAKDQWAGGYLSICRGTGAPATYRIKGNTAAATINAVASSVLIELYDPLQVSLAASTTTYISICGSLFNAVELNTAAGTYAASNSIAMGVTQATHTTSGTAADYGISANTYGWIQTRGICSVLADGTLTSGCLVSASAKVAGAIQQFGVGTTSNASNVLFVNQPVGYCVDPAADTYYATVFLQLE